MTLYLYVKRHVITNLKYFGKTQATDPFKYKGSGVYWTKHIRKHGINHVVTDEIWGFSCQKMARIFALDFSIKNNIVNSKEWANLIEENATDGIPIGTYKGMTYEEIYGTEKAQFLKESRSESNRNRKGKYSIETITKLKKPRPSIAGSRNPMYGQTHNHVTKTKISLTSKGRLWSPELKEKVSKQRTGRKLCMIEKTCPHCGLVGKGGNMSRYHFKNCAAISS